jgi:hypothetical protein
VDDPFAEGARLFDAGEYFEAHEAWERRWKVATDATERRFLQGLIQVAAAFHKLLVKGSIDPAQRLLARGLVKLDACPELVEKRGLRTFTQRMHACALDLAAGRFTGQDVPRIGLTVPKRR